MKEILNGNCQASEIADALAVLSKADTELLCLVRTEIDRMCREKGQIRAQTSVVGFFSDVRTERR